MDIPDQELRDAIRYTKAKTKREAVVTALAFFNRCQRLADLTRHFGTLEGIMTQEELRRSRSEE